MATKAPQGINAKILELQRAISTIDKDKENPHFKYKYASAQNVNAQIRAKMLDLGLVARTEIELSDTMVGEKTSVVIAHSTIEVIDVETGQSMKFSALGSGTDNGDKHAMKANTAATKYATIAMIFGSTDDDPEADARTDQRTTTSTTTGKPAQSAAAKPAPAPKLAPVPGPGAEAAAQGPVPTAQMVVTIDVDKVWNGRVTQSGATGPGTIVAPDGTKYDTFDKGLLETARRAQREGKKVNIVYSVDSRFNRNTISEKGLSVFGEVPANDEPQAENY